MGLNSSFIFSDCHSQTRTCPKAQNQNTEGGDVILLLKADAPALLFPEEQKGEEVEDWDFGISEVSLWMRQ